MHSAINYATSTFPARAVIAWSLPGLRVATLATSLNGVNLPPSELTIARAAAVTATRSTTSGAASLAALLASLMGVNLAACELLGKVSVS